MKPPKQPKPILIIEDDPLFAETLSDLCDQLGLAATIARSSEAALDKTFGQRFGLYLLDVKLPGESGLELLASLRESGDETPAMVITSLRDPASMVGGFRAGCDDFLRKPVDLLELELRILALLRRSGERSVGVQLGAWHFDPHTQSLSQGAQRESLKPQESQLLALLVSKNGALLSKQEIFDAIWEGAENEGALRVYISTLKRILGSEALLNVRGVGYALQMERTG